MDHHAIKFNVGCSFLVSSSFKKKVLIHTCWCCRKWWCYEFRQGKL